MRVIDVKALVIKDGKFLMLRRGKNWDVPTARVGKKSSLATVAEAVKKACNIVVEVDRPLLLTLKKEKDTTVLVVTYLCHYKSGTIKLSKDYSGYKWASSKARVEEDYTEVGK